MVAVTMARISSSAAPISAEAFATAPRSAKARSRDTSLPALLAGSAPTVAFVRATSENPERFTPLLSALPLSNHSVGLHSPCTLPGPLSLVYRPLGLRSPLGQLHPRELQKPPTPPPSV